MIVYLEEGVLVTTSVLMIVGSIWMTVLAIRKKPRPAYLLGGMGSLCALFLLSFVASAVISSLSKPQTVVGTRPAKLASASIEPLGKTIRITFVVSEQTSPTSIVTATVPANVFIYDANGNKLYSGAITGKKTITLNVGGEAISAEYASPVGGYAITSNGYYSFVTYSVPLFNGEMIGADLVPLSNTAYMSSVSAGTTIVDIYQYGGGFSGIDAYVNKIAVESGLHKIYTQQSAVNGG